VEREWVGSNKDGGGKKVTFLAFPRCAKTRSKISKEGPKWEVGCLYRVSHGLGGNCRQGRQARGGGKSSDGSHRAGRAFPWLQECLVAD
jgi:hypothetical protein